MPINYKTKAPLLYRIHSLGLLLERHVDLWFDPVTSMWHIDLLNVVVGEAAEVLKVVKVLNQVSQVVCDRTRLVVHYFKLLLVHLAHSYRQATDLESLQGLTIECVVDWVEVEVSAGVLILSELHEDHCVSWACRWYLGLYPKNTWFTALYLDSQESFFCSL